MYERVSPDHPDKVADRIAGALVDLAYKKEKNPRVAVEVLIGHGVCHIINETSVKLKLNDVVAAVKRISGIEKVGYVEVPQDTHLADNQKDTIKCGDNGIFKGVPVSYEERVLTDFAKSMYKQVPYDGKYIYKYHDKKTNTVNELLGYGELIVCQSHLPNEGHESVLEKCIKESGMNVFAINFNPLGEWTGGTDVDSGATNRKLGSDMGQSVTGGGLCGKDLSKADVSVNIYAFLKAQKYKEVVELHCAIGDTHVDGLPYAAIIEIARDYINKVGGFEKFAEWGLIR